MNRHVKKLLHFLSRKKRTISPLLILTHNYPDPDAMATAYALRHLAHEHFGIEARIAYGGIISRFENRYMVNLLNIPCHKLRKYDLKRHAHVALVDTQPHFRNNSFPSARHATIVIDQHPSVTKPQADLIIVDEKYSATSEILAQTLLSLKKEIPKSVATALICGILTDTLNLYRVGSGSIFRTYFSLLPRCDMQTLIRIQNAPRPANFFIMMRRGIQAAQRCGTLIVAHLGCMTDPVFVAHIADFLLRYNDVQWSFCTGRSGGRLYLSLRTRKHDVLAHEVLRDIVINPAQAGGHGTVAGGSFYVGKNAKEKTWHAKEDELFHHLKVRLRIPLAKKVYYPFRKK